MGIRNVLVRNPTLLPQSQHNKGNTLWAESVDAKGKTAMQCFQEGNEDGTPYESIPGEDFFVNPEWFQYPKCVHLCIAFLDESDLHRFKHE